MSSLFRTVAYYDEQDYSVKDLCIQNQQKRFKGIKSWEPELRPREKMLEQGCELMSNAELLSMLIGSGTPRETAVDLAGRILDKLDGDLVKLSELGLEELCAFAGMGAAKSCSIMAAMELGKRMFPMLNMVPVKKMRVANGAGLRPSVGQVYFFGNVLHFCDVPSAPLCNRSLGESGWNFIGRFSCLHKGKSMVKMGFEETLFKKKGKKGKRN